MGVTLVRTSQALDAAPALRLAVWVLVAALGSKAPKGIEGYQWWFTREHMLKGYARSERLEAWKTASIVGDEHLIHSVDVLRSEKVITHQFNRQHLVRPELHLQPLTRSSCHTSTNQPPITLSHHHQHITTQPTTSQHISPQHTTKTPSQLNTHSIPRNHLKTNLSLPPTPRRIPRPINRPLHRPRNPILPRIELLPYYPILIERTTHRLRDRPQRAVRVEVLPDCAGGGEDAWVLIHHCISLCLGVIGWGVWAGRGNGVKGSGRMFGGFFFGGRRTSLGMAFVLLFDPSLSATWVDWSAMPGVEDVEEPKSWSWRGWVDFGIFS